MVLARYHIHTMGFLCVVCLAQLETPCRGRSQRAGAEGNERNSTQLGAHVRWEPHFSPVSHCILSDNRTYHGNQYFLSLYLFTPPWQHEYLGLNLYAYVVLCYFPRPKRFRRSDNARNCVLCGKKTRKLADVCPIS